MSDWRNIDYRPVQEPEPSEWENLKFGIGVPLLFLLLFGSVGGALFGLWYLLTHLVG